MQSKFIRVERVCRRCGQSFFVSESLATRGEGIYCSRFCYHHWVSDKPLEERFWSAVDRTGDGCWPWRHSRNAPMGYGIFCIKRHKVGAHRMAWELTHGPIPDGLWVLHECDNRPCCNPAHLFLGTRADNMADMQAKGRRIRGEASPNAKLNEDAVRSIRSRHAARESAHSLSLAFGVAMPTIHRIVRRDAWSHVT